MKQEIELKDGAYYWVRYSVIDDWEMTHYHSGLIYSSKRNTARRLELVFEIDPREDTRFTCLPE